MTVSSTYERLSAKQSSTSGPPRSAESVCQYQEAVPIRSHRAKICVRVLLIERRPIAARMMADFLRSCPFERGSYAGLEVEVAGSTAQASEVLDMNSVDVVLLSVGANQPVADAIAVALETLPPFLRKAPIVVFSDYTGIEAAKAAIRGGARGYLDSSFDCDQILDTIHLVATGAAVAPSAVLTDLMGNDHPRGPTLTPGGLTQRELQVVRHLCAGKPNKVIAQKLGMTEATVKVHVRRILKKFRVRNRTEAALLFASTGALERIPNSMPHLPAT